MSEIKTKIFFDGDQYFSAALQAIRDSQDEVCLESFIFQMDQIGLSFLDEMSHAAKRGVKVFLMVDGLGSISAVNPLRTFCRENNIQYRTYHPIPFFDRRLMRRFWQFLALATRFTRRLNYRNHRKTLIVDQKFAMVGSMNISQVHSRQIMGNEAWRDTAVAVEDSPTAESLREAFLRAWRKSSLFRRIRSGLPSPAHLNHQLGHVRLNDRLRRRFRFARDISRRVRAAQKRILITNAYFLPRRNLLAALKKAARNGTYVAICLPAKSDVRIVRYASRTLYRRLIRAGVHIFEYQPSMLHAKTLIVDEWATVGSHNLNHRSFMHDLEVEIAFEGGPVVESLLTQWEKDLSQSVQVTLEELSKDSVWRKMFSRLCFMFRYYL